VDSVEQALLLQRDGRDDGGLVESLCMLGMLEAGRGAPRQGWSAFAEAVRTAQRSGIRMALLCALEGFARALVPKQAADAVRLIAACEAVREELGCPAWPTQKRRIAATVAQARATLSTTGYADARAEGRKAGWLEVVRRANELASDEAASHDSPKGPLTPRENEVAVLLAHGLSNKQIGAELSVSVGTVRSHVDHILAKLELHSRAQVAVWAIQRDSGTPG
jgi:non-specific serine/threonine protein kinase